MRHDAEKLRQFIRYVEAEEERRTYPELINGWLAASAFTLDQDELQYYMELIPLIQVRQTQNQ